MTPLPKRRSTKSRAAQRKGTRKRQLKTLVICPFCKKLKLPHRVCASCGNYK